MYERIISTENLCAAWREFKDGKTRKKDVLEFQHRLEYHIVELREDLVRGTYRHGSYIRFIIHDPKQRLIAKAPVRDRVLHHAIYRVLAPIIDRTFIFDSYASRKRKGVHAGIERLRLFVNRLSENGRKPVWYLKCDIRKFFDSVDHDKLLALCAKKIHDPELLSLLSQIVRSFETKPGTGIPLGNLTSQLLANVYLDPLDQYLKRMLSCKRYLRYNDDFVILSHDKDELERLLPLMRGFLERNLGMALHPHKVCFGRIGKGIDFLGFVHFPHHRVVRTRTKRRMMRKLHERSEALQQGLIDETALAQSRESYLGILSHSRNRTLSHDIRRQFKAV